MAGATPTIISVARDHAALLDPMLVVFFDDGFVEGCNKVVSLRYWAIMMGRVWL